MMRIGIALSTRCGCRLSVTSRAPLRRGLLPRSSVIATRTTSYRQPLAIRGYSAPAGLGQDEVEGRILDLLKNFDKVTDATKLSGQSHFSNDLGLDSLDTVEVVMAIEEEFSLEIPDKEADKIHSVGQAVEYILAQPDAH